MSSSRDYSYHRHYREDDKQVPFGRFDLTTKNACIDRLKRWKYTLDLKKQEKREEIRRKIRAHTQVIRETILFREAGERNNGSPKSLTSSNDYAIGKEQLASVMRDHNFASLERHGEACLSSSSTPCPKNLGLAERILFLHSILIKAMSFVKVKGLSDFFRRNLKKGISGDGSDLLNQRTLGSNTYPRKKGQRFWGIKEGWCDGRTISLSVLVIFVTAIIDYRQSIQFQNLNEKQNIHLEVIRGGKIILVSIFDIVVGDVLKIGDQVPADGILVLGHSLALDESSMTREGKILYLQHKQVNAFQRVQINEVDFVYEKFQDNSYWAKDGENSCHMATTLNALTDVSPCYKEMSIIFNLSLTRDFRHEKTRKKHGSYTDHAYCLGY